MYAFGVLLWEMVCGQRAWDGLTPPQVMLAVACQQKQLTYPNWAPEQIAKCAPLLLLSEPLEPWEKGRKIRLMSAQVVLAVTYLH